MAPEAPSVCAVKLTQGDMAMSETREERPARAEDAPGPNSRARKLYRKPEHRCERIFETMALACGKLGPTESNCYHNRKSS